MNNLARKVPAFKIRRHGNGVALLARNDDVVAKEVPDSHAQLLARAPVMGAALWNAHVWVKDAQRQLAKGDRVDLSDSLMMAEAALLDGMKGVVDVAPPRAETPQKREHRVDVVVSYEAGTYVARVPGKRARRTTSAEAAVKRLTEMLWGEGDHLCSRLRGNDDGTENWRITRNGGAS